MSYLKCLKCGIVRNVELSPECPVCAKPVEGRFAHLNERREKIKKPKIGKVGGKSMWCFKCDSIKKGFLRKVATGAKIRCCPICLEFLKSL